MSSDWIQVLRTNFHSWEKLALFLELNSEQREKILINPHFSLNVPFRLAKKMAKGTLDDPLLKQFVPLNEENKSIDGFIKDPVTELSYRPAAKLLHKYEGRALIVCTSACAMHCRYCFRQHFNYDKEDKTFAEELKILSQDHTIKEVILSGGDPLSLSQRVLNSLLEELSKISHIQRLRFHTRFPIGIPERIDQDFLHLLQSFPRQIFFVIHVNHPKELDAEIFARLNQVQKLGIPVLNQAVLLQGVNDSVEVLSELCEILVNEGILPYYLHQLDRVQGGAHFEVPQQKGQKLISEISKKLSGYAVPKYVSEIPGFPNKTLLI